MSAYHFAWLALLVPLAFRVRRWWLLHLADRRISVCYDDMSHAVLGHIRSDHEERRFAEAVDAEERIKQAPLWRWTL